VPGQFWKDFIRDTAPVFRRPTIEQLEAFIEPTMRALVDGSRYVDTRLAEIVEEVDPDVVVEDNVVSFPALLANGRPWVRIASCNPAEIKDPAVPPPFSGLPAGDPSGWAGYWDAYREALGPLHAEFDAFCRERGAPPLPADDFIHASEWLNLYLYPGEIDYRRERPLDERWHNLQASVRATDPEWSLPEPLAGGEGPLLYLSLGSLGSADVELMKGLVANLAGGPHRVIVSKGPQAGEYELADNMAGAEFLPQTSILPLVDLVITHGGNNTVTESLFFGKPMVALPLFWDQYDNAQRLEETGLGARLDTYGHTAAELRAAIDRLLGDAALGARLRSLSAELRQARGTERAADLIQRVAGRRTP
jgi:MGT family glycosyltransferase